MSSEPPLSEEYLSANRGPPVLAVIIIFTSLALLSVIVRIYTRLRIVQKCAHEDWAVVASMICSIGVNICQIIQVQNGTGRHKETVTLPELIRTFQALYASILLYNFSLALTKISVTLQYIRLAIDARVKLICWSFLWFTVLYAISAIFAGIFQCFPIPAFWDPRIPGKCIHRSALYYTSAAVSIAQDAALIVLPYFILQKLVLPKREKISLILLLGLGGIATIASIVRLQSIYVFTKSQDQPWDATYIATWSTIEINTSILCASLPTLRAFLAKYWPRSFLLSISKSRSGNGEGKPKGQYYAMEGHIMVKKTMRVETQPKNGVEQGEREREREVGMF